MPKLLPAAMLLLTAGSLAAFPIPKGSDRAYIQLAGTTWVGSGIVTAPTTYTFNADGTLTTMYSGRTHMKVGTWTQNGNTVYFECNKKYAEFEGTMTGDTVSGITWNRTGVRKAISFRIAANQ